jgi:hypothetical protein
MTILTQHGSGSDSLTPLPLTIERRLEELAVRLDLLGSMIDMASSQEQLQQIGRALTHAAATVACVALELRENALEEKRAK